MIKFQQSQALTSHFESFWSIVDCDVFGVTNQINIKTNIFKFESFIELVSPAWPQWASFDSTLQTINY